MNPISTALRGVIHQKKYYRATDVGVLVLEGPTIVRSMA